MSHGGAVQYTIAWRYNNAGQRENIRDNSWAIEYIDNDLGRLYTELNSFIDSECGAPPCPAYSTPNMPAVEIYRSYDNFGFAATLGDNYGRSGGTTSRVVERTYDAFDRLVKRAADITSPFNMADATVEQMVYDGQNVALKFNGTTSPTVTRYLHGQAVDQVLAEEQPNNWGTANRTYWTLADHLGTVRDIANQAGVLKDHIAFDAFGKQTSETSTSINVPYGFTGFWYDRDTKLNFSQTRVYDAGTGTWMQQDFIGFDGGDANLMRYVGNAATNATDPTGMAIYEDDYLDYYVLPDGRVAVYYINAGWLWNDAPVFVGHLDPFDDSLVVERNGMYLTTLGEIQGEVDCWGTTSDWNAWFKKNSTNFSQSTYLALRLLYDPDFLLRIAQAEDRIKENAYTAMEVYATIGFSVTAMVAVNEAELAWVTKSKAWQHTLDRHAWEWFGVAEDALISSRQVDEFARVVATLKRSKVCFPSFSGTRLTWARIARVEGKWFVVHVARDTDELVSAWRLYPNSPQFKAMFREFLKAKMGK